MPPLNQVIQSHLDACFIWQSVETIGEWRIFLNYAVIMQLAIERPAFFRLVGEPCGVG